MCGSRPGVEPHLAGAGGGKVMRSTKELVEELESEATRHYSCMIAVGFEDTNIIISSNQPDRLTLLNDAVQQGGIPIGLIVANKDGHQLSMKYPVFTEQQGVAADRTAVFV